MSMNPMAFLQLKDSWKRFVQNHPKFPLFWKAVYKNSLEVGTVIEFKVTAPDGKELASNLKVQESDLEFLKEIMTMAKS